MRDYDAKRKQPIFYIYEVDVMNRINYMCCSCKHRSGNNQYCECCDNGNMHEPFIRNHQLSYNRTYLRNPGENDIKKVIFNDPATIVFWGDGTKTVVKAFDEAFDPEKGLAMAISKKFLRDNYRKEFKKWLPKEDDVSLYPDISTIPFNGSELNKRILDALSSIKPYTMKAENSDK